MKHMLWPAMLAVSTLFSACGGGGGGGDAPTTNYRLTFSPTTLSATQNQGTSQTLTVTATLDRTVSQAVNVAIVDSVGVIEPTVQLQALSTTSYQATLATKASLPVGDHAGNLQVRVCFDNPLTCNSPLPGSPFSLPYAFKVNVAPVVPAAQVSPTTSLTVDAYQDEVPSLQLQATLTNPVGAYPQVVDPTGVFQPNPPTTVSGTSISSTLFLSTSLAAGTHRGNLELRVCVDLPCTQQMPGSPVLVPYAITLRAATNLTPLVRAAGVPEWAQHQANAAHTGFVPVTLNPAQFNRRWRWAPPVGSGSAGTVHPLVTSSGSLYAVSSGYFQTAMIYALNETDSSVRWSRDMGSIFAANPPSTDAGQLYLATSGHGDTFMWSFNAADGTLNFRTAFGSQWEHYMAPAVANGAVYTNGGYYGGLLSFDVATGTQNWFATLAQYDQWTPAVDSRYAYASMPNGLTVVDARTGASAFVISDPNNALQAYSVYGAPMAIGPDNVVLINGPSYSGQANRLMNFDIAARNIKWAIPGSFTQAPAFANGIIYTVNGAQVEARSAADGSRLWSWFPNEASVDPFGVNYGQSGRNLIVTNNLLFVSSNAKVYALDLTTHQQVWAFDRPGLLSLSPNGVLYINSPVVGTQAAAVFAFNLQ